jgi:peptide/nickel transport system permease protein
VNRSLALGLALLALLCCVAAFSDMIAPHERGYSKSIHVEEIDGKTVFFVAPEPPGRHFVLGSDPWGYDLFSEMLHGLRWTLGIVFVTAIARCAIALALGLVLGSSGRGPAKRRGFTPLAAVPAFILASFFLYPVTINPSFGSPLLFMLQSAILVLVELPAVVGSFTAKTASIMAMPFVDAARIGGADRRWIVRHHVLPFVLVDFIEALPVQALSVAAMIGKLGVVKIFIGGTTLTFDPMIFLPTKGEWLGLLGYYYPTVRHFPWLFYTPFTGWLLVLACVSLLASGIRKAYARSRKIEALK